MGFIKSNAFTCDKINISEYDTIDISLMDRDIAILIYNGKLYESTNHQFALEEAMKEHGLELGIDLDTDIDEAVKLTGDLSKQGEIFTWSVFTDGVQSYLISHFEEYLEYHRDLIDAYAKKYNYIIGTFQEGNDNIVKIFR